MSNVSEIYTLWLKPWHLPAGKPISVTIEKAETRTIHPRPTEERTALVLSFVGKNRKLILNDGNANKMSDIGGEDWAAWRGLVVQLKRTQFTKDKETIHILPGVASPAPSPAPEPSQPTAIPQAPSVPAKPTNGHTDPTPKGDNPYKFTSTASKNFYDAVQAATDNFYSDAPDLLNVIGGWFNFQSQDLWSEKLSMAVDHARIKRQSMEVEDDAPTDDHHPGHPSNYGAKG